MHEIGERQLIERAANYLINDPLIVLHRASTLELAQTSDFGTAISQRDWPLDGGDQLSHGNVVRFSGQAVSALDAALRNQKAGLLKNAQQFAHRRDWEPGFERQIASCVQALFLVLGYIAHENQSVVRKLAEPNHECWSFVAGRLYVLPLTNDPAFK